MHLTLKFLGEVDPGRIDAVKEALKAAARGIGPLTITAGGVGGFPSLKSPRVVWVGVADDAGLSRLASNIEDALSGLGFERETRGFHPHLTLCRVKSPADGRAIGDVVASTAPEIREQWQAGSFALYKSVLSPKGAEYTVLGRIDLKD